MHSDGSTNWEQPETSLSLVSAPHFPRSLTPAALSVPRYSARAVYD